MSGARPFFVPHASFVFHRHRVNQLRRVDLIQSAQSTQELIDSNDSHERNICSASWVLILFI